MGGEDDCRTVRYVVEILDGHGPLGLEIINDLSIMNDLVAHVDRPLEHPKRLLDDFYCPNNASAEPSWLSQYDTNWIFGSHNIMLSHLADDGHCRRLAALPRGNGASAGLVVSWPVGGWSVARLTGISPLDSMSAEA